MTEEDFELWINRPAEAHEFRMYDTQEVIVLYALRDDSIMEYTGRLYFIGQEDRLMVGMEELLCEHIVHIRFA